MNWKKYLYISAGFLIGSILFTSVAFAATRINVTFLPLTFYFDGVVKAPPQGQQSFIYNGTTYVPLRFMADAMGKSVTYVPKTYSLYVGSSADEQTVHMKDIKPMVASEENSKFSETVTTNQDVTLDAGYKVGLNAKDGFIRYEYALNGQYKRFVADLAPGEAWGLKSKSDNIGSLKIYCDDKLVYDSKAIPSDLEKPYKVQVDLTGVVKLKIDLTGRAVGLGNPLFVK